MALLERLLILVAIAVVVAVATVAIRSWSRRRVARIREAETSLWSLLGEESDGRPGLLVFSSPACVACRTAQEPAARAVGRRFGPLLRVVHVDIGQRPGVARAFKILTAPSTVILNPAGRIRSVNQGFASADQLSAQLSAAGATSQLAKHGK